MPPKKEPRFTSVFFKDVAQHATFYLSPDQERDHPFRRINGYGFSKCRIPCSFNPQAIVWIEECEDA
jgi:hypothetical protein